MHNFQYRKHYPFVKYYPMHMRFWPNKLKIDYGIKKDKDKERKKKSWKMSLIKMWMGKNSGRWEWQRAVSGLP